MRFDKRKAFVAVLDTMWGMRAGRADSWYLINPYNHSGRRLYRLTDSHYGNVAVVNACPQLTTRARQRGTPSPVWLAQCLRALPRHYTRRGVPLLVCGKVAQAAFEQTDIRWRGPVIYMLHPAARTWTKASLVTTRKRIARAIPQAWRT